MTRAKALILAVTSVAIAGLSAFGLFQTPPQNWALATLAIGSDLTAVAVAFLLPHRYRRIALIYCAFLVLFSVLVVAAFWR